MLKQEYLLYQQIIEKHRRNIQSIYDKIIDYGWNSPDNNWAGHHFKTIDGFEIKTNTIQEHNCPEGESVSIYKNGVKIYDCTYMLQSELFQDVLKPLITFTKERTGCNHDHATAVAEYIYGTEMLAQG